MVPSHSESAPHKQESATQWWPANTCQGENGRTMGWLTSAVLTAWRRVALPA